MASGINLSPGVVIDFESGRAFLMAPEGGVTAVALSSGGMLWHSDEAEKPLLLTDGLLVSQADLPTSGNEVLVRMLRAGEDGGVESEGRLPVSPSINTALDLTPESSFTLTASPLEHDAILNWEFRERHLRGLVSGPDEVLPGEDLPEVEQAGGLAMEEPAVSFDVAAAEPRELLVRGQARLSPRFGNVSEMVEPSSEFTLPTVPQLSASMFDAALPADFETPENPNFFESADRAHLLYSSPLDDEGDSLPTYRWEIRSRETSELVGVLHMRVGFAPFVVRNNHLFVELQPFVQVMNEQIDEQPLQLCAYDINSGDQVWSQPLRDIYFVPAPPP
ncbi:hypothetical protein [Kordiimonas aquimaris]|uniref:hypothetical protein n=1 Tax=Kordiimonas aquimaris TaxID=707591 RepID=UPI0021D31CF0|nr:hypothetical protein [Kordiimonas aquimaris]